MRGIYYGLYLQSSFAKGRAAGTGVIEDRYDDESHAHKYAHRLSPSPFDHRKPHGCDGDVIIIKGGYQS